MATTTSTITSTPAIAAPNAETFLAPKPPPFQNLTYIDLGSVERASERFFGPQKSNEEDRYAYIEREKLRTSRNNRILIYWDMKCLETTENTVIDLGEEDEDDERSVDKLVQPLDIKAGEMKRLSFVDGILEDSHYNGKEDASHRESFNPLRHEVLRLVATVLGSRHKIKDIKKMTASERQAFFENPNTHSMTCRIFEKIGVDRCTVSHLKDAMLRVGPTATQAEAILQLLKNKVAKDFKGLKCVQGMENDHSRIPHRLTDYANSVPERYAPNDQLYMKQWHLLDGEYAIRAPEAWAKLGYSMLPVPDANAPIVAVIDTGCSRHRDLWIDEKNNAFWRNIGETDCFDGIDNDKNGYVDDCWGWNFVKDNPESYDDDVGHGTSVVSVLGALCNNHEGTTGTYWGRNVMCLKAGGANGLYISDTLEALNYAIENGAAISNHSYGGIGYSSSEWTVIRAAEKVGHLLVTAAGNIGCNIDQDASCYTTPGAYPAANLMNVGASTDMGRVASFSSYGKTRVHLFAPGQNIFAATVTRGSFNYCTNCFAALHGTSYSAPIVTGIVAELWAYYERVKPIGFQQMIQSGRPMYRIVKNAILDSVTPSNDIAGLCVSNGVVNFANAVDFYDNAVRSIPTTEYHDTRPDFKSKAGERVCSETFLLVALLVIVTTATSCDG